MVNPKYPQNLAIAIKVDSHSSAEDRKEELPLMSVSKSFCGVVCALMAADGEFGENKINATLDEVFKQALISHPERSDKIKKWQKMIADKGFSDLTIAELLNHRSGTEQSFENTDLDFESDIYRDNRFAFISNKLQSSNGKDRGKWQYNNWAYELAREVVAMSSKSGDYYQELQNRILTPLKLSGTKALSELQTPESDRSPASKRVGDVTLIAGVLSAEGAKSKISQTKSGLQYFALAGVPLAAGGLSSTVDDMTIYAAELSKVICGLPNKLVSDPAKLKELHAFYRDSRKVDPESAEGPYPTVRIRDHAQTDSYSLGIMIGEKYGKLVIEHSGGLPSNKSNMQITMPFNMAQFEVGNLQLNGREPEVEVFMEQVNHVVKYSLLNSPSIMYFDAISSYFGKKSSVKENQHFNGEGANELRLLIIDISGELPNKEWQSYLIEQGELPSNFAEYNDKIFAAFAPVRQVVSDYLTQNYLKDGVIDNEKIAQDFKTADHFKKIESLMQEKLKEIQPQIDSIFLQADERLVIELQSRQEKPRDLAIINVRELQELSQEKAPAEKPKISHKVNIDALDLQRPKNSPSSPENTSGFVVQQVARGGPREC